MSLCAGRKDLLLLLLSFLALSHAAPLACPTAADFAGASQKASFKLPHAAVARLGPSLPQQQQQNKALRAASSSPASPSLLLTTFGVGSGTDSVLALPSPASSFSAKDLISLDSTTAWPNEIAAVPPGVNATTGRDTRFSRSDERAQASTMFTVAGGFFAEPDKATGSISIVTVAADGSVSRNVISTPKQNFFYHHVAWLDVDGDGSLDLLAARAKVPTLGKAEGELVWLHQAGGQWQEQVLTSGPDVYFTPADINGDGKTEIIAAQFFTEKALNIYACGQAHWSECVGGKSVSKYVVDAAEDAGFFDIKWADINGDGRRDLLATTNAANGDGGVIAFELVGDFTQGSGAWKKHVLATGFKPTLPWLPGRGAVGSVEVFALNPSAPATCRPALALSGDDGAFASILVANGASTSAWDYTNFVVYNSTGTVGQVAVGDLDGNGVSDLIVPDYAENKVTWLELNMNNK